MDRVTTVTIRDEHIVCTIRMFFIACSTNQNSGRLQIVDDLVRFLDERKYR